MRMAVQLVVGHRFVDTTGRSSGPGETAFTVTPRGEFPGEDLGQCADAAFGGGVVRSGRRSTVLPRQRLDVDDSAVASVRESGFRTPGSPERSPLRLISTLSENSSGVMSRREPPWTGRRC